MRVPTVESSKRHELATALTATRRIFSMAVHGVTHAGDMRDSASLLRARGGGAPRA